MLGYEVVETREPGGTAVAEAIRDVLLGRSAEHVSPETEALLIFAARRQHVTHVVKPALQRGAIVLCDRFMDSTLAYQGHGRGLSLRWLNLLSRFSIGHLTPAMTLLIDLPVRTGLTRRRLHRGATNRLDRESARFHERIRRGFLTLARKDPRRITVIDASQSIKRVADRVSSVVIPFVRRRLGSAAPPVRTGR